VIPRWADREADAPGLVTRDRTWSCGEVSAALRPRIDAMHGAGLVAITGASTPAHLLDLLAAIEARVPALVLHPRWTEREREALLARARPSRVLDGGAVVRTLSHAVPRALDGTLAVVATSGTSGTPKLALLSRRAFEASAYASAAHLGAQPDDRWLLAMPLAHVGGLGVVVRSLVYRAPIVLGDASDWVALADEAKVTHVSLVPTMLARWLDGGGRLPSSVRAILVGGAACSDVLLSRARHLPIHPTYGLTETCGQVATATTDPRELVPLPGVELRIERGTIRVRTPTAMDGWLDAESPFDADGFYDTGDLGTLGERGLVIHARRTDLIVSGGENVYPREVEDVLERIQGVRAVCVFGVPDATWGERVAAAIVVDASAPTDAAIVDRARRELAAFKVPRLVARVDALATNASGKVDRSRTKEGAQDFLRAL
jgi:O-succinylbenzoic acid--CoA ligase